VYDIKSHLREKTTFTDPRLAFARILRNDSALNAKSSNKSVFTIDTNAIAMQFLNDRDLSTKTAIITGANRGLGYEICRSLAFAGCYVIMACRSMDTGEQACKTLKSERVT
jgi:hypothetical protein